jgi:hypothetical protein
VANLRSALHVALVTVCVTTAYELESTYHWRSPAGVLALVALSYVLTSFIAGGVAGLLFRAPAVRMLALRRAWIEGYWYLLTYDPGKAPVSARGLGFIEYVGSELELKATVFKPKSPESGVETASTSELAELDSRTLQYLNFFNYQSGGETINGVVLGHFYRDGLRPYPTRFHGVIRYFASLPQQQQIGRRISRRRVRKCIRKYQYDWVRRLLAELEDESHAS